MLVKKESKLKTKKTKIDEAKKVKKVKKELKDEKVFAKKRKLESESDESRVEDAKKQKKMAGIKLTKQHVSKCLDAILKITEEKQEIKKDLLENESDRILIQVNCIKIPQVPQRFIRLNLPHALVSPDDDIAFFVPDLEKGLRQDYEKTIEHWEKLLQDEKVKCINEIIPFNKVKTEFRQYEMLRKLGQMHDFFLVDGRIAGHLSHILSKCFERTGGPPSPVAVSKNGKNLKNKIEVALKKSFMRIHGNGDCHTSRIASIKMPKEKIIDNIFGAWDQLEKLYPGGTENIRSIMIKTKSSPSIPIYFSTVDKNSVKVPVVKSKRPKAFKTVQGELTTLSEAPTVKVSPSGEVSVLRNKSSKTVKKASKDVKKKSKEVKTKSKEIKTKSKEVKKKLKEVKKK